MILSNPPFSVTMEATDKGVLIFRDSTGFLWWRKYQDRVAGVFLERGVWYWERSGWPLHGGSLMALNAAKRLYDRKRRREAKGIVETRE